MASTGQPARWMHDMLQEGFALLAANRLNDASECCRRLLQAKPDLVEAHFLVGLIALELKQTWAAVSAFGSVTKLKPDHGAAWAHMAKLFMAAGQPNRADLALENAIRHEDGNPVVHDLIGTVHAMLGEQQEALHWYGKAVGKEPRQVAFLVNHANSQMYLGNLREAEEELHNVLALQPGNPNAHWLLSGVRKAVNRDHADQLYELAAKAGISPRASAFLNYALGKELEDLEQWDQAFEAFARGAAARRQTVEFDEAAEIEMFDALAHIYTADWLDRQPPGHPDASPIFVVGQPRTGTTLVERIITSHAQVHSAGELRQFGTSIRRLINYRERKRFSARLVEEAAKVDAEALGHAYMLTTRKVRGDLPRFVDKLPSNFLYVKRSFRRSRCRTPAIRCSPIACRPGFRHRAVPSSTSRTGTIRPGAWSRTGGRTTPRSCSAVSPPATNPAASAASTSSPASRARFTVDTSPTRPSTDRRISVPRR
jgi:tetratricopeptide (TPR) repeat protein